MINRTAGLKWGAILAIAWAGGRLGWAVPAVSPAEEFTPGLTPVIHPDSFLATNSAPSGEAATVSVAKELNVTGEAPPQRVVKELKTLAGNLAGVDGIARNPVSGDVYVSLEETAMILRIRLDGTKRILIDASTPVQAAPGSQHKATRGLRSPEGVALDGQGGLYVVEDIPGGRLIRYDIQERTLLARPSGQVIEVPFTGSQIAWESVDVGPNGELLLAGSTMEHSMLFPGSADMFGLARGVILYRDADGAWWMPISRGLASYSAAVFSADGKYAFYACEMSGEVGCLDLQAKNLRTFAASHPFRSPEGISLLSDGQALVAEESGRVWLLDAYADRVRLLFNARTAIESLEWIPEHNQVLVTADQNGSVLAYTLTEEALVLPPVAEKYGVLFEDRYTTVEMIPDDCPNYLEQVLKMGGYVANKDGGTVAFRDFAQKYCLVAIDAQAEPLEESGPIDDPIVRLQFVIMAPYLMGVQGGELLWSSSGFVALKRSGKKETTQLVSRDVIQGDLLECRFTPVGGQSIALPMPFSTRIDNTGSASIHLMGMGAMPDYLVGLNTLVPEQSFMLVMLPDQKPQQYRLNLPAKKDRNHWVIALRRKELEVWKGLSVAPP